MLTNFIRVAIRQLRKNTLHTFINILCLSLGLTASLLSVMFITDELSFDKFHSKHDRIFRLNKIRVDPNGAETLNAESSGLMGPTMASEFPEVENFTRFQPWFNSVVLSNDANNVLMNEGELVFVDSAFFSVFDFKLVKGDPSTVLQKPRSIVLTEKVAHTLFNGEDPIGKTVKGLEDVDFVVTGIAADAPRNSHIQYRALVSWSTTAPNVGPIPMEFLNNWIAQAMCTYIVLRRASDEAAIESKLPMFMTRHMPTRADRYKLYLQPLDELYLKSYNVEALRMQKMGSEQFNYLFSIIAAFILFLACINYINISTSKATRRAREVAMRKTLGAKRKQLVIQFLGESLIFAIAAALLALVLLVISVPYFNQLTGKSLPLEILSSEVVVVAFIAIIFFVSVASGLYPGLVLSSFAPAVIQGTTKARVTGSFPRHVLIVFQFVITMCMITGTLLIYQQIKLVLSADLGFDKEHVVLVNMTDDVMAKREALKEELRGLPNVASVSTARTTIGLGTYSTYVIPEGFRPDEVEARVFVVDEEYQKTYGLEMAAGRFFEESRVSDSAAVIINEKMVSRLNWHDPLEKTIRFSEDSPAVPVIGVLKDFHFKSLYEDIEPLVMVIDRSNERNLTVRFSGNPSNILAMLEEKWKTMESRYPFNYTFVDQAFARAYESEEKLLETVLTFAGLSILIACLGLYGLVSFTIEQRTKELGIRKVLGASVTSLSFLVNKKFILLALVGGLIAVPVVVPFVNTWLEKFVLKVNVTPMAFLLAFALMLLVTVIAVSVQAVRAALANPVDALRHE
jgi:putative ABC transport system permease protein